jgi:methylmalonyl-CoA mutase
MSAGEVARQAVDADVHVVGVSSQAAGHMTLVPQLVAALKEEGMTHVLVVLGGIVPEQVCLFISSTLRYITLRCIALHNRV